MSETTNSSRPSSGPAPSRLSRPVFPPGFSVILSPLERAMGLSRLNTTPSPPVMPVPTPFSRPPLPLLPPRPPRPLVVPQPPRGPFPLHVAQPVRGWGSVPGPRIPRATIGLHQLDGIATFNVQLSAINIVDQVVLFLFGDGTNGYKFVTGARFSLSSHNLMAAIQQA